MKAEVPSLCQLRSMQSGPYRDSVERKKVGRGSSARMAAGARSVPVAVLAHLHVNSPSTLLAAAFPCWL